jgi:hypothetical protein
MNGGTYDQALKAGFPEKEAGFFARFGAELQSEILAEFAARQEAAACRRRVQRIAKLASLGRTAVDWGILIAVGFTLGKIF